jgi:hypothetical protein
MPINFMKKYTRSDLRANRNQLFVFGDNMVRQGRGGQAAECRDEPNAVGIPTKWNPSASESAYFSDLDIVKAAPSIDSAFNRLAEHIRTGGTVIWPSDNVGTGLAKLREKAPAINAYIQRKFNELCDLADEFKRPASTGNYIAD